VDFSEASRAGLLAAERIARFFSAGMRVLHVEVASAAFLESLAGSGLRREAKEAHERHLAAMRARIDAFVRETLGEATSWEAEVCESLFVPDAIVDHAADAGVDWICMGATGHTMLERLLLGSTAVEVLRRTRLPVLTFRERPDASPPDEIRRVLVAADLHEGCGTLVDVGAALAGPDGELVLLHAVDATTEFGLYGAPLVVPAEDVRAVIEWSEIALNRFLLELGEAVASKSVQVRTGRPGDAILTAERELEPDLVVIGTHGRHGLERLALGSVAERVARRARGPVLVVPTG
jgi:nucleotide-binding universal stress UspA family protein